MGRIARAHGIRGGLKLSTFDHEAPSIRVGVSLHLLDENARPVRTLKVTRVQRQPDGFVVQAEGITTREAAEALEGMQIHVDAETLPALQEGEFWAFEMVGWQAVDENGQALGEIAAVQPGPAHDFLTVRTPGGDYDVPLVEALVVRMDRAARTVVLRPPEGLLDDVELKSPPAR
ncbi:MAG: ribosome maturation factor RimM [Myxococcota bacterium]